MPASTSTTAAPAPLASGTLEALRASIRGTAIVPGDPGYDAARAIWNGMIDRKPAVIVRVAGAADVIATVRLARDTGLPLAVRGGGHNIAGNAVCDAGIVLDCSAMRSVRIDPDARTARVEPGASLADFDREAQAFGLATPTGINSTTGIAGLTLGGGFGWISRRYGLTVDNLIAADVVTADGQLLHASETSHPELFWALRGGGGNFGVVTSFEFKLHKVGPQVLAGLVIHPLAAAKSLIESYRSFVANAPDELTTWFILRKAPPLPFVSTEWHGKEVLIFAVCWCGSDLEQGEQAVAPLRALGTPIADIVGPMPFVGWQSAIDPLLTPGARNYWKSHDFTTLSDGLVQTLLDYAGRLPSDECEVFIGQLGAAVNRRPFDSTAFPHRNVEFVMNVHTRWRDAAQDDACIGWARGLFDATGAFATGAVYVNFMPTDETTRVKSAYGPNYDRLVKAKAQYDPKNLFRLNQNIAPA